MTEDLSLRELEVLRYLAWGHTNASIAPIVGVSPKTIETYKMRGFKKLGIKTRVELVRHAVAAGWFKREPAVSREASSDVDNRH